MCCNIAIKPPQKQQPNECFGICIDLYLFALLRIMDAWITSATAAFSSAVERAKKGDKLVLAAGGAAVLAVAYTAVTLALRPNDGEKYMSADQKALSAPFALAVAPGRSVTVERISSKDIGAAADTLASGTRADPIMKACGSEVSCK